MWDGITLNLSVHGNNVEKIFLVSPHSDVSQIRLAFDGIDSLSLDASDRLVMHTKDGSMTFDSPISFQYIDGVKKMIPVKNPREVQTICFHKLWEMY